MQYKTQIKAKKFYPPRYYETHPANSVETLRLRNRVERLPSWIIVNYDNMNVDLDYESDSEVVDHKPALLKAKKAPLPKREYYEPLIVGSPKDRRARGRVEHLPPWVIMDYDNMTVDFGYESD
jgi:hypothetical protein